MTELILVRCFNGAFQFQLRLVGVSIGDYGEGTGLEAVMAFAVVGCLDDAVLVGGDRLAREVAGGAAAAGFHVADDERCVAGIGEVEGIGHHLALQEVAELMLRLVEADGGLFDMAWVSRLGVVDDVGGEAFFLSVVAGRE